MVLMLRCTRKQNQDEWAGSDLITKVFNARGRIVALIYNVVGHCFEQKSDKLQAVF